MPKFCPTLRQLQVFKTVATLNSFTRASEALHLSQPAVSIQVKQLGKAVGLPLFEQFGKKIYLTKAGEEILHYSEAIHDLLDEAGNVIEALKGVKQGHFNIAVATTANSFTTHLLAAFRQKYQGATFSLDVTNRQSLLQQLKKNEIDVVIMGEVPKELPLEAEAFMDNPLVIVAAPEHHLAKEKSVPLWKLEKETFVVREAASGTRIAIERYFAEQDIRLHTEIEMTSNEAIKQAVEAGLGLAIVSQHTLKIELESKHLVILNVEGFPILRHWYLVYRSGKRLSPVVLAFREFLLAQTAAASPKAFI